MNGNTIESHQQIMQITMSPKTWFAMMLLTHGTRSLTVSVFFPGKGRYATGKC